MDDGLTRAVDLATRHYVLAATSRLGSAALEEEAATNEDGDDQGDGIDVFGDNH